MSNTLSVVLFAPASAKDVVNACLATYGYGDATLSVELDRTDGSKWYGCHTWVAPVFLEQLASPPPEIDGGSDAATQVIVSTQEGGEGYDHWMASLSANEMTIPYVDVNA